MLWFGSAVVVPSFSFTDGLVATLELREGSFLRFVRACYLLASLLGYPVVRALPSPLKIPLLIYDFVDTVSIRMQKN